jgi:hypothetical protein
MPKITDVYKDMRLTKIKIRTKNKLRVHQQELLEQHKFVSDVCQENINTSLFNKPFV